MSTRKYTSDITGLTTHLKLQDVATGYWVLAATGATEAYNADHLADYKHADSEPGMAGQYVFAVSDDLAAGTYLNLVYEDDGTLLAAEIGYWDGSEWHTVSADTAAAKTTAEAVDTLTKAGGGGDLAEIATNAAEILAVVGTTGAILTEAERNAIADALLDRSNAVDTKTLRQAVRIMAAILAGKVSGAGTGIEEFVGLDGLTTRVTVSATSAGNRTSVTYA